MKKRNGFTLIELLAIIVILAIIAFITTPLILNIIEKTRIGAVKSSAFGYIDSVEKQVAINELDSNKSNINDGVYTVEALTNEYKLTVKGQSPSEGWVSIHKGLIIGYSLKIGDYIVSYDVSISQEHVVEKDGELAIPPSPPIEGKISWSLTTDENGNGIADMGDLICASTECFYVISNDGENIKMLARYNLNVGDNKVIEDKEGYQSLKACGSLPGESDPFKGAIEFSNTSGWADYAEIDIQMYDGGIKTAINAYKEILESMELQVKNIDLITKYELNMLGCDFSHCNCNSAVDWVNTSAYWSKSADVQNSVWAVSPSNRIYPFWTYSPKILNFGVRPVITISVSNI